MLSRLSVRIELLNIRSCCSVLESNTDKLFWTLATIIVAALLLTIGVKTFPKMAQSAIAPISGITKQADIATSSANKTGQNIVDQIIADPTSANTHHDINTNDPKSDDYILKDPAKAGFTSIEYRDDTKTAYLLEYDLTKLPKDNHLDIPAHIENPQNHQVYTVTQVGVIGTSNTLDQNAKHPFCDQHNPYSNQTGRMIHTVHLPNTIKVLGWAAFTANHITDINIPMSVEYMDEWALNNENFDKPVYIPNPKCYVNYYAFSWSYENNPNTKIYQAGKGLINDTLKMD